MSGEPMVTAEQLERMGEREPDFELVRGSLVPVSPAGGQHGVVAAQIAIAIGAFASSHSLGRVYIAETGFVLSRNPDTVRAPDVSFVSRQHPAGGRPPHGFIVGAPDLAVEVRSPDNTPAVLATKANEYLAAGGRMVWVVDPILRVAHVHRVGEDIGRYGPADSLDGHNVLPGFSLPLAEVFSDLDAE